MSWYHCEVMRYDVISSWIESFQSSPHIEAARPGCACAFGGLLSFVWHPAAISGPRHQKKNILTISAYSISNGKCPTFCCNYAWSSQAIFFHGPQVVGDPSLVLCLCFIHSFGSSFPHYACRPTTTELWAISRTTHNQKITGGSRGGPLSTGVSSHKSSMRKNIAWGAPKTH